MKNSETATHGPQDNRQPVGGCTGPTKTEAITKAALKVGSALPTFSAPPIEEVVLSNLNDADLVFVAKNACSIHAQSGAYAREFLAELKRRFNEGKRVRKPYFGYKSFNNLCANKLEISARQVRNILNNDPGGRKGRVAKPRRSLKDLEEVKAENKRLLAHVRLIEADNVRFSKESALQTLDFIPREIEQAKKDAVRDHQKIAAKEKQESENKIATLESTLHKLTLECRRLQKQPKQVTSKRAATTSKPSYAIPQSPVDELETWSKDEAVRRIVSWTVSVIKHFPGLEKRWIVDEATARLRGELDFGQADTLKVPNPEGDIVSKQAM
jgi:hypothetical protein